MTRRIQRHSKIAVAAGFVLLASIGAAMCPWTEDLTPVNASSVNESASDGIPIRFSLDAPGYVTLVIEDADGHRVRNLVANTYFQAGEHTVYWDGYDAGKAVNYSNEGGAHYDIERHRVAPGTYHVRGLVHDGIRMRYALSVQSPGTPPWHTLDGSGAWLSDHAPPIDVLMLPGGSAYGPQPHIMVSAPVAEAGHSLMWLDLDGHKLAGQRIGWEGAYALARDAGSRANPAVVAYAVSVRKGRLTLLSHNTDGTRDVLLRQRLDADYEPSSGIDLEVYNQHLVVSLPLDHRLAFFDVRGKKAKKAGTAEAPYPKGLMVDEAGRLYVIQNRAVRRYRVDWERARLEQEELIIDATLDDPRRITKDEEGRLYVSDWGRSHQVKVFTAQGQWLHTIGGSGGPQIGRYDEQRMHHPNGLAIDKQGRLWVAELDYAPKRLSLWTAQGTLIRTFYGPPRYGGGGVLDPADSTRFYYATGGRRVNAGIVFTLDWERGEAIPKSIYKRGQGEGAEAGLPYHAPAQPIHFAGRTYLVNTFNQASHGMRGVVGIWLWNEATETTRLVSVVGFHGRNKSHRWAALDHPDLVTHRPDGIRRRALFYIWSDLNSDGQVQPDEVQYAASGQGPGRIYVGEDLRVLTSWLQEVDRPRITPDGVPYYDLATWRTVAELTPPGEGDILYAGRDWVVSAGGPVRGFYKGGLSWSYHSPYYNRSPSPSPADVPGQLVETSRVLGLPVHPREGDARTVWAVNNDKGSIYLFTADGLFLDELGGDVRTTPLLRIPEAPRGQVIEGVSFNEEHFWPTLTQLDTGAIYLVAGKEHTSLFNLTGFDTVERRDFGSVIINEETAVQPEPTRIEEASRQTPRHMTIAIRTLPPRVDGDLGDWNDADWVTVDAPRGITSAVTVAAGRLYVAYRTNDPALLNNAGAEGWHYLFTTGGGLDLMFQQPPAATADNVEKPGAARLFVTRLGDPETGPLRAVRFQQGGRADQGAPMIYRSAIGEVRLESVADVSNSMQLAQNGGDYEFSVPLSVLGLVPTDAMTLTGDVGVLIGNGAETQARLYWSNKTATQVSDLPSEAGLDPRYWGTWIFQHVP